MKIWIAVLVGFVLGALSVTAFRPTHPAGIHHIHIVELNNGADLFLMPSQGSHVVGFSCVGTPQEQHCFVATSE